VAAYVERRMTVVARCLLGCRGTTRHAAAEPGTGTGGVADEPAQADTESTDLAREQRTLNPRVSGPSPWRRTRPDLGVFDHIGDAQCPFWGSLEAVVAPWLLRCGDLGKHHRRRAQDGDKTGYCP
jgi:hypothetical protein